MIRNSIKHWYILLIIGLLFVGLAIFSFTRPLDTYLTLAVLFGAVFLASGFLEIIFSIVNREEIDNWGWSLVSGLLTLLVGLILVGHPGITMVTLPFIVGFAMLFRSIASIGHAIDLKKYKVADWGYLLTLGILGTLFSIFIIMASPGWWAGCKCLDRSDFPYYWIVQYYTVPENEKSKRSCLVRYPRN